MHIAIYFRLEPNHVGHKNEILEIICLIHVQQSYTQRLCIFVCLLLLFGCVISFMFNKEPTRLTELKIQWHKDGFRFRNAFQLVACTSQR